MLRRRVLILVAATVLPLGGLLAANAYQAWRAEHEEARRDALTQARLVSGALATLIDGARHLSVAVAQRLKDMPHDSEACAAYLRSVVGEVRRYYGVGLLDPSGKTRCSSNPVPRDLSLADRDYFRAALESHDIVVGHVITGRFSARPSLPLALAYRGADGAVLGVVVIPVNLEKLAELLGERFTPERGFIALIDPAGTIAARVPEHALAAGRRLPAAEYARLRDGPPTVVERDDFRGRPHIVGVFPAAAPAKGFTVLAGIDRELVLAQERAHLIQNVVIVVAIVLIAILAAWWLGERLIQRPIGRFIASAQLHAAGDLKARFPQEKSETEFTRLGAALNTMAAEIERLVDQKKLLLREVQHRVMNSLQLLGSFLHLQARHVEDEKARKHLKDARERIVSMSIIYRHLYHSEAASTVEVAEVLRAFCEELERAYLGAQGATITVEAESIELPTETALSLALITHELVTNALKHAYPEGGGVLDVSLRRHPAGLELAVADEGRGLPADFDVKRAASLGIAVIQSLTRQLRGAFTVERRAKGTRFAVTFPLSSERASAAETGRPRPTAPPARPRELAK